ncbi:MAG: ZIP family metal transporter [Eubacterium sp.]
MIITGILIPFLGTTLGSACVLFMKNRIKPSIEKTLLGFSAGVMVAASVWSLLIPSIDQSSKLGKFAFAPAVLGFMIGIVLLPIVDKLTPRLKINNTSKLVLAVTLHNIPEGMAVGVIFAGVLSRDCGVSMADAMALSIGIAIQNFPEGAIISLPLKSSGKSVSKAFLSGALSGIVEPISAVITLLAFSVINPALPYLLAFAAGAMVYVVVEELIPEASLGTHNNLSTFAFALGFAIMMTLDVVFG